MLNLSRSHLRLQFFENVFFPFRIFEKISDSGPATLPETNIAPENGWLEYDPFLLGAMAYFQGRAVSFRECSAFLLPYKVTLKSP